MRTLERQLGATPLDRTTHRVRLTDAGRALLPEARRTLAAAAAARDAVDAVRGVVSGTLRIGLMQSFRLVDLAAWLVEFRRRHPAVEIRPRRARGGDGEMVEDVRGGELDVAIDSIPGVATDGIDLLLLAREPIVWVASAKAEVPCGPVVRLEQLRGLGFVEHPPGWGTRALVDQAFAGAGIVRRIAVEVPEVTTGLDLVRAGFGVSLLPRSMVASTRGLQLRPVAGAPESRVRLATPTGRSPSAAARAFAELVRAPLRPGAPPGPVGR